MTHAIALIVGYKHTKGGCYVANQDKKDLKKFCFSMCNCCFKCGSINKMAGKQGHNCDAPDPNRISWGERLDEELAEEYLQYVMCA